MIKTTVAKKKEKNTRRPWGKNRRRRKDQSIGKSFQHCFDYLKESADRDGGRLVRAIGYAMLALGEMAEGLPGRPVNILMPPKLAKLMEELKSPAHVAGRRPKLRDYSPGAFPVPSKAGRKKKR